MIFLKVYLGLFLLTFIVSSIVYLIEEDYIKEIMILSALNILYLAALIGYRSLKHLSRLNGTRILGYKPITRKDFSRLGVDANSSVHSIKSILKVLMAKGEVKDD